MVIVELMRDVWQGVTCHQSPAQTGVWLLVSVVWCRVGSTKFLSLCFVAFSFRHSDGCDPGFRSVW